MKAKRVAILGATGHIAKSLIDKLCRRDKYELVLFYRSTERLNEFLESIPYTNMISAKKYSEFSQDEYEVIINCIGIGNPAKLKNVGALIFRLTEKFDNMILDYLEEHPEALYINFSSGAVYGTKFNMPVNESTCTELDINHIVPDDFYSIAKLNAEAKHRAMADLNIVDLRVFGYFSRFINLNAQYFMSEVISCIKDDKVLVTVKGDMVRDYIHPSDLVSLIEKCIHIKSLNDVFDVYSLKPVTKFEILECFAKQYGLDHSIKDDMQISAATGIKNHYYSVYKKAEKIGYFPQFSSMDSIIEETKLILNLQGT
ncbi:MAG: NAD(P)-dependent oxidoreductase [Methanococcoides sp.]|nr:NAD(P)-dependent oxidoreductase [Methanococcoides sp.]